MLKARIWLMKEPIVFEHKTDATVQQFLTACKRHFGKPHRNMCKNITGHVAPQVFWKFENASVLIEKGAKKVYGYRTISKIS